MTEINDLPQEFKNVLGTKKVIFGSKSVLKALKLGKVEEVVFSSNAPESLVKDLEHYSKLAGVELKKFVGDSRELGVKCKRAHSVLVTALLKGSENGE